MGKAQHPVAMEQTLNYDFGLLDANQKILKKNIKNVKKSNECNQCDYVSSRAGNLRTHLKTHSGEKSNKCSQCAFDCPDPNSLGRHMKRHRLV